MAQNAKPIVKVFAEFDMVKFLDGVAKIDPKFPATLVEMAKAGNPMFPANFIQGYARWEKQAGLYSSSEITQQSDAMPASAVSPAKPQDAAGDEARAFNPKTATVDEWRAREEYFAQIFSANPNNLSEEFRASFRDYESAMKQEILDLNPNAIEAQIEILKYFKTNSQSIIENLYIGKDQRHAAKRLKLKELFPFNCSEPERNAIYDAILKAGFGETFLELFEKSPLKRDRDIFPPVLYIEFQARKKLFDASPAAKVAAPVAPPLTGLEGELTAAVSDLATGLQGATGNIAKAQEMLAVLGALGDVPPVVPVAASPAPDPRIEIVDVEGGVVDYGGRVSQEMLGFVTDEDRVKRERVEVPHIKWIEDAVWNRFEIDGKITVYQSPLPLGKTEEDDFSLKLIDFKTKSGEHHQIATNNWYAGGTYVIKPPVEIDLKAKRLVHIAELLTAGQAWPVRCCNQEQYTKQVIALCETPSEKLKPYLPKIGWSDKGTLIWETAKAHLMATGKVPLTTDKDPIEYGPLKGLTTWSRVYGGLHNGSVKGLEETKDLHKLFDVLIEKHPELKQHLGKPAVKAERVLKETAAYIRSERMVPQGEFLSFTELCGWKADQLSGFFAAKGGVVTDWRKHLPKQRELPPTLEAFLVASGLAINNGVELQPNWRHELLAN
jgi:hypothetical protein